MRTQNKEDRTVAILQVLVFGLEQSSRVIGLSDDLLVSGTLLTLSELGLAQTKFSHDMGETDRPTRDKTYTWNLSPQWRSS